jgi:hypothetical protein
MVAQQKQRPVKDIEGERYRMHVPSRNPSHPDYLVDLESNDGIGECGCDGWQITMHTRLQEGEDNPDRLRCYHVKRALIHWAFLRMSANLGPKWYELLHPTTGALIKWAHEDVQQEIKNERRKKDRRNP